MGLPWLGEELAYFSQLPLHKYLSQLLAHPMTPALPGSL
jgi:hypothetical protein